MISIYTDGSCRHNGSDNNIGAYGFIAINENNEIIERFVQREYNTTNQRCEILALISAYEYLYFNNIQEGLIYTDSAYCANSCNDKWYIRWEKNGFKSAKGNSVLNQDLWKIIIPYFKNENFKIIKVAGHSDNFYNNIIDSLVTSASDSRIDYIKDQTYGDLTVVQLWDSCKNTGKQYVTWKTVCKCGKIEYKTSHSIKNGKNNCTHYSGTHAKDLREQTFGFLMPLTIVGKTRDNYALWECLCINCNTKTIVSSRNLKKQISCGCVKSKGETLIAKLLNENNCLYEREHKFDNLKDTSYLKFDFALFNYQGDLIGLIEFQGEQHYISKESGWNNSEHLEKTKFHDQMKQNYCDVNNIPLIIIPYYDYDILTFDYITKKFSDCEIEIMQESEKNNEK